MVQPNVSAIMFYVLQLDIAAMSDSIRDQLNEACRRAVMDDDLHIEYINISLEGFNQLALWDEGSLYSENLFINSPITWRGVELRKNIELSGVTFNLVTTPFETPAWGGSPKGRLPG